MAPKKLQYKISIGLMFFFGIIGGHQQFSKKIKSESNAIDGVESEDSHGVNSVFSSGFQFLKKIPSQTKAISKWGSLTFLGSKAIGKYQNSGLDADFQKNKDYTKQLKVKTINLKNQFEKNNAIKPNNPLDNNDHGYKKNDGDFININREFSNIESLIDDIIKSNKNKDDDKKNNKKKRILVVKNRNKNLEERIKLLHEKIEEYENKKITNDNTILASIQEESWKKNKTSIN
jgi:hypothetical protein